MAIKGKGKTKKKEDKVFVQKEKIKKETILIECTDELKYLNAGDIYNGKKILDTIRKFGKQYLLVDNIG